MAKTFQELVVLAILDPEFRATIAEDPYKVVKVVSDEEYVLSPDEMEALTELKVADWESISIKELDEKLMSTLESASISAGSIWIKKK